LIRRELDILFRVVLAKKLVTRHRQELAPVLHRKRSVADTQKPERPSILHFANRALEKRVVRLLRRVRELRHVNRTTRLAKHAPDEVLIDVLQSAVRTESDRHPVLLLGDRGAEDAIRSTEGIFPPAE